MGGVARPRGPGDGRDPDGGRERTAGPVRACGSCSACCAWLPVKGLDKPANTRCKHQRHRKGCAVYHSVAKPPECAAWTCGWLDGADIPRPDHAGWLFDAVPDVVLALDHGTGAVHRLAVVQVWTDPQRPEAWDCPALYAGLEAVRMPAIVRFGSDRALALVPPWMTASGRWERHESEIGPDETMRAARVAGWRDMRAGQPEQSGRA